MLNAPLSIYAKMSQFQPFERDCAEVVMSPLTTDNRAVMLAANSSWNLLNFRNPVIEALLAANHRVLAAVPNDGAADALRDLGVEVYFVPLDARGISPVRDLNLLLSYRKLFRRVRPAALLPFTAKPNIYGSIAAGWEGIPTINTITGLGTAFLSGRGLNTAVTNLYRWSLRQSVRVYFHNSEDRDLFIQRKLLSASQARVVPGSGIDLERFSPVDAWQPNVPLTFLFIGRLLKDKGALEFANAAAIVRKKRLARFQMLGSREDHPKAVSKDDLKRLEADGTIELLGSVDDVRPSIARSDCIVLPSYREGLPRVLLEASAMAKPVIATDVPGCRQAVDADLTGILCEARSAESLAEAMMRLADMPVKERLEMGARGRHKAEQEFSKKRVADAYLEALRCAGI
jgi:glycosyltransferase involved in cell wall biosynthesis